MRAIVADRFQHLSDVVEQVRVENWFVQLDVTEVTRAVYLGPHTRLADAVHVHGS